MVAAALHAAGRNPPDALRQVDLRPGRASRFTQTRYGEDDEENDEFDRRVHGQRLPVSQRLGSLAIPEGGPVVGNLPNRWQEEPLEISSRIVGPVLVDDGIAQDVLEVLPQGVARAVAPVPMGNGNAADILEGDRSDGLVADDRKDVFLEATAPRGLGGLHVPILAAHLGNDLVDATERGTLLARGLQPGITAGASNPAVVERDAPRLGKREALPAAGS